MPMMHSLIDILLAVFIVLFFLLLLSLVFIFIMHILMPRKVLETYFKEPHFSAGEIVMLTGFPFGYMRTGIFMRVLGVPAKGEKRGIENSYQQAPAWYCKVSKYFILFFDINMSLFVVVTVIGSIYMLLYE